MSLRPRRLLATVLAFGLLVVAAAMNPTEQLLTTFQVTLGLRDKEPSDWSGQITVGDGEVTSLTGWRFEDGDAVQGTTRWKCRTHPYIAPERRYPVGQDAGKPPTVLEQPWANGVKLTVRGAAAFVKLKLPHDEVAFKAAEVLLGEPKLFLDGQVRVERLPETIVLRPAQAGPTENARQDDYPAFWIRYKTGKHYLSWVTYDQGKDRVLLAERDGPAGKWAEPVEVAGPGDHFRVALASTHDDTLWVVWSSQRQGNWDLFARAYKDGKLGPEVRLTENPGPDLWHRMTTDRRGRAWLVWQGFRNGQADIFARCADGAGWHDPTRVSNSSANDWDPAIAADAKEDRVWIGWDTYETGNYGVRIRSLSGGPQGTLGDVLTPEKSGLFNAHVSLASDRDGRLWAAWDESGMQWGKDTGFLYPNDRATRLYQSRRPRIKCLVDGRWLEPAVDFQTILGPDMHEYNELPQLQPDSDGRLWLAFRHRVSRKPRSDGWAAQGGWESYATAFLGDRWLAPILIPESAGRNDMRASSQRDRDGNVYFAHASDHRAWMPPSMLPHNLSVAVTRLTGAAKPVESRFQERTPHVADTPVHPREKEQVARIRAYQITHGGKTYRIYRGDLHRHTDISADGVGDGSLMDLHRYALDAAALDYILVGDHNMGHDNEYCWWRTQKANDLYSLTGSFLSMYGYERSVPYPNGHRNVIWTERGHRTLPLPRPMLPGPMARDTAKLYAYLQQTDGICASHTSATNQGTNWAEHDDRLEPFVEIFQGYHTSYEAPGAPKTNDEQTAWVHGPYKPDGFVSRALGKGYRLGFQASSDHVSTHVSYACILAEEFSRKGLVAAMRQRHTYGATDNIVLDVRMGSQAIMGDEVQTDQPRLEVVVLGTNPIERIDVLRNGAVVHTERPKQETADHRFRWEDAAPVQGDKPSYYYVRVMQKDGQMAWASPFWVRGGK